MNLDIGTRGSTSGRSTGDVREAAQGVNEVPVQILRPLNEVPEVNEAPWTLTLTQPPAPPTL